MPAAPTYTASTAPVIAVSNGPGSADAESNSTGSESDSAGAEGSSTEPGDKPGGPNFHVSTFSPTVSTPVAPGGDER